MKLNPQELDYYSSKRSEVARGMACWSPVKNLFIGMRGKIMTCCYNKSYVLGNHPAESLRKIWFGEKRNNLITSLKENDFSLGCQGCLEGIKAGNINVPYKTLVEMVPGIDKEHLLHLFQAFVMPIQN